MDIIELERQRMEWAREKFPDATDLSSLNKLGEEIRELKEALFDGEDIEHITEEYADCLMCLFDSAGRAGIYPRDIFNAFEKKLQENKLRKWKKNNDNTYSHEKS